MEKNREESTRKEMERKWRRPDRRRIGKARSGLGEKRKREDESCAEKEMKYIELFCNELKRNGSHHRS
jgi:hypothetical protein